MLKTYKIAAKIILFVILLSVLKIDSRLDNYIKSYPLMVAKSFLFKLTKLNWQYGFFTTDATTYCYIKYDIIVKDNFLDSTKQFTITKNGMFDNYGSGVNDIRLNTIMQKLTYDSLMLEAGSRSIALNLFNKYPEYRNVDFKISQCKYNCVEGNGKFELKKKENIFYHRILCY